jgi:hypothetical protein
MSLKMATVITAISNLSVTLKNTKTLVIKTTAGIPEDARELGGILFPKPGGFVTDFVCEHVTYGANGVEKMDVSYTLNYTFCDIPGGSNRAMTDNYDNMVYDVVKILDAILTNDSISNGVELEIGGLPNFGNATDPTGNWFYGTDIQLNIKELYEV